MWWNTCVCTQWRRKKLDNTAFDAYQQTMWFCFFLGRLDGRLFYISCSTASATSLDSTVALMNWENPSVIKVFGVILHLKHNNISSVVIWNRPIHFSEEQMFIIPLLVLCISKLRWLCFFQIHCLTFLRTEPNDDYVSSSTGTPAHAPTALMCVGRHRL